MRQAQARVRHAFWAAWVFLVAVVALGFYIQARTIERLQEDELSITSYVERVEGKHVRDAEALCGLMVVLSPQERPLIARTFRELGYRCVVPG